MNKEERKTKQYEELSLMGVIYDNEEKLSIEEIKEVRREAAKRRHSRLCGDS